MTYPDQSGKAILELPLPIPRAGIPKGVAGAAILLISRHPHAARASQPPTPVASSWSGRLESKGVAAEEKVWWTVSRRELPETVIERAGLFDISDFGGVIRLRSPPAIRDGPDAIISTGVR